MKAALLTVCALTTVLLSSVHARTLPLPQNQHSPISLDRATAQPGWLRQDALQFDYGSETAAIDFRDHHHHRDVIMNGQQKLHIRDFNETFVLEQFHLHWGESVDHPGSEHAVNGRRSVAEIHFVHRNVRYANFSEALGNQQGILVLGVLVDTVEDADKLLPGNGVVDQRVDDQFSALADLKKSYSNKLDRLPHLDRIDPLALIPVNSPFLHYTGALTFSENGVYLGPVEWIVFENPLIVSVEKLDFLYEFGPANYNDLHEIRGGTVIYRSREDVEFEGSGEVDEESNAIELTL